MSEQTEPRTTAESAADAKRRGQAIAGAIGGVAVVMALVAVFIIVRLSDDTPSAQAAASAPIPAAAASPAAPSEAPAAPSEAPSAPQSPPAAPKTVNTPPALKKKPVVKAGTGTVSALKVTYLVRGKGAKVAGGDAVTTNYVLVAYQTGEVLDNSWDRGQMFTYRAGGDIIQGFDKGMTGVPVGSRVQLDVPAALAYGPQQGDLRFVVDVLAIGK
jgi:peptidylprolyl isomerase